MWFFVLFFGGLLVYGGVQQYMRSPRRAADGSRVLVDYHDHPLKAWLAGAFAVAGLAGLVWVGRLAAMNGGMNGQALLELWGGELVLGLVGLVIAWAVAHDALTGEPGRLAFSRYPLTAGETATVTFTRKLRRGAHVLQGGRAELVLYHLEGHGKNRRRERCACIPLGDGGAALKKGAIRARWAFDVPDPSFGENAWAGDGLLARMADAWSAYEWVFEVHTPLERNPQANSAFHLQVQRGQARLDETGGAVGRRAG